ncbi:MAG TPA: helix-turn-helix domain-containing protein [Terriglobales bacterium]|jgi:excisionase family DNA binding protein|nr:helix-turn-helix domain-containing protein [Terriglobales bacterium]
MVATAQALQFGPRDQEEIEQASKLYRTLLHEGTAALISPDGTRIDLPSSVYEILVRVAEKMQEGKTVAVLPLMEELSTQAAADLLGISRQFFVRECEAHKLPFHYTGTHRRVLLRDLLDYKKQREQARREAIVRIARQSEELGDYDKFIPAEER